MESTNIIVEAKKISELPISLDFSEDAVVLIVDKGKTMQLNVDMLIQAILKKAEEANESIETKIKGVENKITAQEIAIQAFEGLVKSLRQSVTNKFKISDAEHENMNKLLSGLVKSVNSIRYYEEVYDYNMMQMPYYTFTTHHAVAGEVFTPVVNPAGEGYYACAQQIEEGWVLSFDGCQELVPSMDSKYFVVTNEEGIALDVIPIQELMTPGFEYEFKEKGTFYLSSQRISNDPLFKLKIPETVGVPKVSYDDEGKILQVVNGNWKAVDIASVPVGNEVEY